MKLMARINLGPIVLTQIGLQPIRVRIGLTPNRPKFIFFFKGYLCYLKKMNFLLSHASCNPRLWTRIQFLNVVVVS